MLRLAVLLSWSLLAASAEEKVAVRHPNLRESSGVTRSGRSASLYWTHNDSGNGPQLFAFDLTGKLIGIWNVTGAENRDWEDIGIGPGPRAGQPYLYIADIGDNGRHRAKISVYRVLEPRDASAETANSTEPATRLDFTYPDGPHDAEALFVHPKSGAIYVVTKTRKAEKPGVYKAAAPHKPGADRALIRIGELNLPGDDPVGGMFGRVTGAAISPGGDRVALCGYSGGYEALAPQGKPFDGIFAAEWRPVDLGKRAQGEGVTYASDGRTLVLTSEGSPMMVTAIPRAAK